MSTVTAAMESVRCGRFSDARKLLASVNAGRVETAVALLQASVSEMTGHTADAERIANHVTRTRSATDTEKAGAEEFCLG